MQHAHMRLGQLPFYGGFDTRFFFLNASYGQSQEMHFEFGVISFWHSFPLISMDYPHGVEMHFQSVFLSLIFASGNFFLDLRPKHQW